MKTKQPHNPATDEDSAQLVAGPEAREVSRASTDLEAAWLQWSNHRETTDKKPLTLLRDAFEAGWEAAQKAHAD